MNPQDVVNNATIQSKLLMDIVSKTKCYQIISGKRYLQVEAWETIGAFNRVHAITRAITPILRDGETVGYDADVRLVNSLGLEVGGAIMPCYFTENACKGKEGNAKDKACKSAAQTFAESKAYRMNYSYIAILAGYEPTPAEEMTGQEAEHDETGHYCEVHKTHFFKKGKMKTYAHPIGNTGEWCREPSEKPKPPETNKEGQPSANEEQPAQAKDATQESTGQGEPPKKPKRDPSTIKNITQLQKACFEDFGIKSNRELCAELNITSIQEISDCAETYAKIAGVRS